MTRAPRVRLLLKIGGSVATDPRAHDRVHAAHLNALAPILLRCQPHGVVIVHGTGHVGKPAAIRHGFERSGVIEHARRAIALEIRRDLRALNGAIAARLRDAGLRAQPVQAEDVLDVLDAAPAHASTRHAQLDRMLAAGVAPVLHGDMVPGADGAYRVLSSDAIMVQLAQLLEPALTVFLTDVDGVLDADGRVLPEVDATTLERVAARESDQLDVSGGMGAKVRCALRAARSSGACFIANGTHAVPLRALLDDHAASCTRVRGARE